MNVFRNQIASQSAPLSAIMSLPPCANHLTPCGSNVMVCPEVHLSLPPVLHHLILRITFSLIPEVGWTNC